MDLQMLGTPLEALLFRYSITAAGSLWTWLAVLTAAVGLWRIRSVASKPVAPRRPMLGRDATNAAPAQPQPVAQAFPESALSPPRHVDKDEDGRVGFGPKGTFFAAYDCHVEDDGKRGREEEVEGNVWDGDGEADGVISRYIGCWGRDVMGRRRTGDLGWYRYQDLTALNGSVVRLWDDDRRPSRRGRRWPA